MRLLRDSTILLINRDIFLKIISTNRKTSIQQLSKFIDEK